MYCTWSECLVYTLPPIIMEVENRALEDVWLVSKHVIFHFHDCCWRKNRYTTMGPTRWVQTLVISKVVTNTYRGEVSPVTHLFSAIYRGAPCHSKVGRAHGAEATVIYEISRFVAEKQLVQWQRVSYTCHGQKSQYRKWMKMGRPHPLIRNLYKEYIYILDMYL